MNKLQSISACLLAALCALCPEAEFALQPVWQRLRTSNVTMAEVQPAWMAPLIQSDSRIAQGAAFSVSRSIQPGAEPFIYGNNSGIALLINRRLELDVDPPSYFRDHCGTMKDGFGNAGLKIKGRIASGNAAHGNYAVSASLFHAFAPGVSQNQMLTAYYIPEVQAGRGFGRYALLTTIGGLLPMGKISTQGRMIQWNLTAQARVGANVFIDVENNTSFFHAGRFDGQTQNFITPAVFYKVRRKEWKPTHPVFIFDGGEQIATSASHCLNHNVIVEMRVAF